MKTAVSTRHMVLCALFAALIAAGAFLQVPVPFMDYFTLQFLFVILAGMLMGGKRAAIAAGVYVAVGLCGIPVFAAGGGPQYIFRPSFGYLLGFIAAAALTGFLCEKMQAARFRDFLPAAFAGLVVTYLIGFAYKYMILNFHLGQRTPLAVIFLSAFPLDLPGDILLCIVGAGLAGRLRAALKKEELL